MTQINDRTHNQQGQDERLEVAAATSTRCTESPELSHPTGGPACVVKDCNNLAASVNPRDDRDRGIVMCRQHYDEANTEARQARMAEPRHLQTQQPNKIQVSADQQGLIMPKSLDEAYRYSQFLHNSGMLPARYDNPGKVMAGMQYALELGLKPLTALRQIAIIEGTPSIFGDLPLAIVQQSGELEFMDEYWMTKEKVRMSVEAANLGDEAFASYCAVKRRGRPVETRYYDLDLARKAGLYPGNSFKPWAKYTRRMLKMRARSEALKDVFPDLLNGMSIGEYDHHTTLDAVESDLPRDTTQAQAMAAKLGHRTIDAEQTQ